jgi:hypothetical protein
MPSSVSFRTRNRSLVYSHNHNNERIEDIKTPPPEIWLVPPSSDSSGEASNPVLRVPQLVENQSSKFTHTLPLPVEKVIKRLRQTCGIITADIFIEHRCTIHYGWRTEALKKTLKSLRLVTKVLAQGSEWFSTWGTRKHLKRSVTLTKIYIFRDKRLIIRARCKVKHRRLRSKDIRFGRAIFSLSYTCFAKIPVFFFLILYHVIIYYIILMLI